MAPANPQLLETPIWSWQRLFYLTAISLIGFGLAIFALLLMQNSQTIDTKLFLHDKSTILEVRNKATDKVVMYRVQSSSVADNSCDVVDSNLGFETGDLRCWITDTIPPSLPPDLIRVVPPFGDGITGFDTNSVLLGDPNQDENSPLGPNGSVSLSHIHRAKIANQGNPELHFDYLMYSHDVMHAVQRNKPFDSLEAGVVISGTMIPLKKYGNPKLDWNGYESKCRPTPWKSNSGVVKHESLNLAEYRGKTVDIYFTLRNETDADCNSWAFIDNVQVQPEMTVRKMNDPSDPVHEGDVITYTISYANTGLATQTGVVITDRISSNTELVSVSSPPDYEIVANSVISWTIGTLGVGETGVVSFQVRVSLLPSLSQSVDMLSSREAYPPAQVVPVPIACDTTRFWAIGVTRQPSVLDPHTIQVQIPPGTDPSEIWLLMKGTNNTTPTVGGHPAQLLRDSSNAFGASLWTAPITPTMVAGNQVVTVTTYNESEWNRLNALFLFDKDDPPFERAALDDFYKTTETFTYALDIPSVATKTIDVILPFMDITYWTDAFPPEFDTRRTTVTVQFDDQSHTVVANDPNLGNGLLMTEFPFTIGPLSEAITSTKVLTVTVDTEDSVYTLGPRVCRPVYIKNTAWLCSDQVGCVSDTVTNVPEDFQPPGGIYLPIILKSSP